MKTLIKTTLPELSVIENKHKANTSADIADMVMDLYNLQLKFGVMLQNDMHQLIDNMEFAYPNDAQKFRRIIDRFLGLSQTSLLDDMKKILNLHVRNNYSITEDTEPMPVHNREWMKELAEQLCILKGIAVDQLSANEEFYYYETAD